MNDLLEKLENALREDGYTEANYVMSLLRQIQMAYADMMYEAQERDWRN